MVDSALAPVVLDSAAEAEDASFIPKRLVDKLDSESNGWEWESREPITVKGFDGEEGTTTQGTIAAKVVAYTAYGDVIYPRLRFHVINSKSDDILLSVDHLRTLGFSDPNNDYLRVQRLRVQQAEDPLSEAIRQAKAIEHIDNQDKNAVHAAIKRIEQEATITALRNHYGYLPTLQHLTPQKRLSIKSVRAGDAAAIIKELELANEQEQRNKNTSKKDWRTLIDGYAAFTRPGWAMLHTAPVAVCDTTSYNFVTTTYLQSLATKPKLTETNAPAIVPAITSPAYNVIGEAAVGQATRKLHRGELRYLHGGKGGRMTVLADVPMYVIDSPKKGIIIGAATAARLVDEHENHIMDGEPSPQEQAELDLAVTDAVEKPIREGTLTQAEGERLRSIAARFKDCFRIRLGRDPPARVPAMTIKLKEGAQPPKKPGNRRYSPQQERSMTEQLTAMLNNDIIYPSESPWISPVVMVKKPNGKWRLTFDARYLNNLTRRINFPSPRIPQMLQALEGSKFYITVDLTKGYWQMKLDDESQKYMTFTCPMGTFSFRRAPMGALNTGAFFQRAVQQAIQGLEGCLNLSDDVLIHAADKATLFERLQAFLERCERYGLKLNPRKTVLFATRVVWCGQEVSASGIRVAPSRLQALDEMGDPETIGDLMGFFHSAQYCSSNIPRFAERTKGVKDFMNERLKATRRGSKREGDKIPITKADWVTLRPAFEEAKQALRDAIELAHYDETKHICVWTDASKDAWAGVVTATDEETLNLPIKEQIGKHSIIGVTSGLFTGSELNWGIPCKEGAAIIKTLPRFKHFLMSDHPITLFTDHLNLRWIFDPCAMQPSLNIMYRSRLARWAMALMDYAPYRIVHAKGDTENVFADLLTRWGQQNRAPRVQAESNSTALLRSVRCTSDPTRPAQGQSICACCGKNKNKKPRRGAAERNATALPRLPHGGAFMCWPTLDEIKAGQALVKPEEIDTYKYEREPNGLLVKDGAVVIPDWKQLRSRVMATAHQGMMGHRRGSTTHDALQAWAFWPNMTQDIDNMLKGCLQCAKNAKGEFIPRALGHQIAPEAPHTVISADFLEIDGQYLLVIKDLFSRFVLVYEAREATAIEACKGIMQWIACFSVPSVIVTDGGSHFKNDLLKTLTATLRMEHHITTPHCPFANGGVERVNLEFVDLIAKLRDELGLECDEWKEALPIVCASLNSTPRPSLGKRSPLEVHTGRKPVTPVEILFRRGTTIKEVSKRHLKVTSQDIKKYCTKLRDALDAMYVDVQQRNEQRRKANERARDRIAREPQFRLGDIVLAYRRTAKASKTMARTEGPFQVVDHGRHGSYMVRRLDRQKRVEMSPHRMIRFADCEFGITQELVRSASEGQSLRIDKILGMRQTPGGGGDRPGDALQLRVRWIGFPDGQDTEWRSVADLYSQAASMVKNYLLPKAMQNQLVRTVMTELLGMDSLQVPPAMTMRKADIYKELRSYGLGTGKQNAPKAVLAALLDTARRELESNNVQPDSADNSND
jgi:hypothetical protein